MCKTNSSQQHVTCPTCKGKKTRNWSFSSVINGELITEKEEMKCIDCDGKGVVTKQFLKAKQEEEKKWCKCDNSDFEKAIYVDDNTPGALVKKHHWICGNCEKILQIG